MNVYLLEQNTWQHLIPVDSRSKVLDFAKYHDDSSRVSDFAKCIYIPTMYCTTHYEIRAWIYTNEKCLRVSLKSSRKVHENTQS